MMSPVRSVPGLLLLILSAALLGGCGEAAAPPPPDPPYYVVEPPGVVVYLPGGDTDQIDINTAGVTSASMSIESRGADGTPGPAVSYVINGGRLSIRSVTLNGDNVPRYDPAGP